MTGAKVVVSARMKDEAKKIFKGSAGSSAEVIFLDDASSREEVLVNADVLVSFFFNREIQREEYELLKNLRLLQTISAGVDYLPFTELPSHIEIASNAGGWAYQIAEHSVAMAMALYKRLIPQHKRLSKGDFNRDAFILRNLAGKTFGVVGFGGIGKHTARLMKSIGMNVYALNTSGKSNENIDKIGKMSDLEDLLSTSDVVLLSLPLTKHTRGLIGRKELQMMKRDAVIINVARAPLMDEEALYEHLAANPEFMAGLDVWWEEPSWSNSDFNINYPFFDLDNFIGSPHNSNNVEGAVEKAVDMAGKNVAAFLNGDRIAGKVNREDYILD